MNLLLINTMLEQRLWLGALLLDKPSVIQAICRTSPIDGFLLTA